MVTTSDAVDAGVRMWTRRLTLAVVLATCIGGGAYVLADRPTTDCGLVAEMMGTYLDFQNETAPRERIGSEDPDESVQSAVADAEDATAQRLRGLAGDIETPALRAHAVDFAAAVAKSAQTRRAGAQRPAELDPFDAVLPELDPGRLADDEKLFAAAHVLLTACPTAPRPYGMT